MSNKKMYVEVAFPISVNKEFCYFVTESLEPEVSVGKRVLAPFKHTKLRGYIVNTAQECTIKNPKEILRVIDSVPIITDTLFKIANWISNFYICSLGEALDCIFSVFISPLKVELPPLNLPLTKVEKPTLEPGIKIPTGLKKAFKSTIEKNVFVLSDLDRNMRLNFYYELISYVLKFGNCILLLPEISLVEETSTTLTEIFGNCIVKWHSKLSDKEKYTAWLNTIDNKVKIAVGTRSAVFLPFRNLKLIIIDTESDYSYKNPQKPFYDAISVSRKRANFENCIVLVGSELMSLSTYFYLKTDEYKRIKPSKIMLKKSKLPSIKIVQLGKGRYTTLSDMLCCELEKRILKNELSVLFINRKGFATAIICPACGFTFRCPNCGISLVYHRTKGLLKCHYCSYSEEYRSKCTVCNYSNLRFVGKGTEKIKSVLETLFPGCKILLIDKDVIKSDEDIEKCIKTISTDGTNIIVGTQFLLTVLNKLRDKNFSKISLVGICNFDNLLYFPDFRSTEKAFSIVYQLCRLVSDSGTVVIQTYNKRHYIFKSLVTLNSKKFYQEELNFRKELLYPPVNHIMNLVLRGKNSSKVKSEAERLYSYISEIPELTLLGPDEPPHPRLRGNYREHIIVKLTNTEKVTQLSQRLKSFEVKPGIHLSIDVNPWEIF